MGLLHTQLRRWPPLGHLDLVRLPAPRQALCRRCRNHRCGARLRCWRTR